MGDYENPRKLLRTFKLFNFGFVGKMSKCVVNCIHKLMLNIVMRKVVSNYWIMKCSFPIAENKINNYRAYKKIYCYFYEKILFPLWVNVFINCTRQMFAELDLWNIIWMHNFFNKKYNFLIIYIIYSKV